MRSFIICLLFFISCSSAGKLLPESTGDHSEVIFVVDDTLWDNLVGSLVGNVFGEAIKGVSQVESLFRIIQVNHSEFKSILKTHKNVIIVAEGVKKSRQINKWSSEQFVAQLIWENNPQKLRQELLELRTIFTVKELKSLGSYFTKLSQKKVEAKLSLNFGINCIIPKEYQVILNDSNLFWAKYDPSNSDEIKNILLFSFVPRTVNLQAEVLFKTDSILAKYLIGSREGSYVQIEKGYPPYYHNNIYRGLWKLEHGFMGGPLLIKTYFVKNRIVVNLGLVFAPQSHKRKYIKEFEAIL